MVMLATKTIRESIEDREYTNLSPFAQQSSASLGRPRYETYDETRTCFMVDRDRILYSNAFKRLKDKTQVWINPGNDHFENRLSHTLQVAQLARTMAVAMNLNETMAEAAALCHDIAHSPFGHAGGDQLNIMAHNIGGWEHEREIYHRLEHLEKGKNGIGLNISFEVIDAAKNHSGLDNNPRAKTKEGKLLPYADKIAYLTSDFDNALKVGIIKDAPDSVTRVLGKTKREMINTMIKDVIEQSMDIDTVIMSDRVLMASIEFRDFMYNEVYFSDKCLEKSRKAKRVIEELYNLYLRRPELIPKDYTNVSVERNIVDYISSMTDRYCSGEYVKYFMI